MRARGLAVDMPTPKRPTLRAVLLDDGLPSTSTPSLANITVADTFEVPTQDYDAEQLMDLAEAASGRLRVDVVGPRPVG